MRPLILVAAAAALTLGACRKNDQADSGPQPDQGLTAENIVSNDVTAIDAVTADAANMAADVDYSESLDLLSNNGSDAADPATAKRAARPKPAAPAPGTSSETATNAQ